MNLLSKKLPCKPPKMAPEHILKYGDIKKQFPKSPDHQITKPPKSPNHQNHQNHQITKITKITKSPKSPNHQITKSQNHQITKITKITRSPNPQITKSPNHQITKSPNHQITKSPNHSQLYLRQTAAEILLINCQASLLCSQLVSLLFWVQMHKM